MNVHEEIIDIVGRLKNLMVADMEMGLGPPAISPSALEYLQKGPSGSPGLDSLEDLRSFIGDCKRCKLSQGKTNLVFGEGSPEAELVFIGEGPGREEDLEGRPFVGEAGKMLTRIIEMGMGLNREDVYICNVVKCRPPGNRDPEPDEIKACIPFLKKQLELIRPRVICLLGRVAARALIRKDFKITNERGKWYSFMDIRTMPTFHPAYLIRNPAKERYLKGLVWKDIKKIMKHLGLEVKKNA